jgi:polyhydroxybutyrate depolymerase
MSYQLACELSDRIAAIASVTGSMNMGWFNSCNPNHPMPIMEIHGTADGNVPYATIPSIMDFWANFNNCNSSAIVTNVLNTSTTDGCTAEHQIWENGNNGSTVEHYKIIGGEHSWPGALFPNGVTNQDIDASEKIWEFFSKYDINGLISPTSISNISNDKLIDVIESEEVDQDPDEHELYHGVTRRGDSKKRIRKKVGDKKRTKGDRPKDFIKGYTNI